MLYYIYTLIYISFKDSAMNYDDRDKLLRKVKHCLAMGESSNENEAASAIRQASKMMERHGISKQDLLLLDIKYSSSKTDLPRSAIPSYLAHLSGMIAFIFGCKVFYEYNMAANKYRAVFVGLDTYSEIAGYAFDVLSAQLKSARKLYLKNNLNRVRIKKNKYTRADSFCLGWVKGVAYLVKDIKPPVVDCKMIEQKLLVEKGEMATAKTSNTGKGLAQSKVSADYIHGFIAGEDAHLHNAVQGEKPRDMISHH